MFSVLSVVEKRNQALTKQDCYLFSSYFSQSIYRNKMIFRWMFRKGHLFTCRKLRHFVSAFPAGLLELQSAVPNRLLESGAGPYPTPSPFGLFCASILLCALKPSAAQGAHSPPGLTSRLRGPSRVHSQGLFFFLKSTTQ